MGVIATVTVNPANVSLSAPTLERRVLPIYQRAYDNAYASVRRDVRNGDLVNRSRMAEPLFIGQEVDRRARNQLRSELDTLGIGSDQVRVNRSLRLPDGRFVRPDVYFPQSGAIFDGSIGVKSLSSRQIQGFVRANHNAPIHIVLPRDIGRSYTVNR